MLSKSKYGSTILKQIKKQIMPNAQGLRRNMSVLGSSSIHIQQAAAFDSQQVLKLKQFSKKPLNEVGELPFGEIPEPLKFTRPFEVTTISNGIRVCTESWDSPVAAVGVFIGAGTRNETVKTSGAAHFLEHLHFKGTRKRSRVQLEKEVENLGSQLNAYTSRELTLYHMLCFNDGVEKSVEVLADMLCNSIYDNYHLEMEKETIWQELLATNQDYMETLMESVYNNIYKDHMMGMPILGEIDNIYEINRDMVVEFHDTNYFGENVVICGTGQVNHQQLVDFAEKYFHKLPRRAANPQMNTHKPTFHASTLYVRDDEMPYSNAGVFYNAPSWKDKDFYSFLLMQRVFGNYSMERNAEHLNDVQKQYNSMHALLAENPDITRHDCIFSPYSDCGIFGHYFFGNDPFMRQMNHCGTFLPSLFATHLQDAEVFRARNKLYDELFSIESATDTLQQIGPQMLYLNRHVSKNEIATRVAHIDTQHLRQICKKYFADAEPSITNWGPQKGVQDVGTYKYFKVNNMSTATKSQRNQID